MYDNIEQLQLAIIHYITDEYFTEWIKQNWEVLKDIEEMESVLELYSKPDLLEYYKESYSR